MVWTMPAWAQDASTKPEPETGHQWLAKCGSVVKSESPQGSQNFDAGLCLGWVEGLLDMTAIYHGLGALERTPEGFCLPNTATLGQAARVIAKYLEGHSSALHFSARMLAYMALRDAFPCSRR
jgi:hypothetical protein